MSSEDPLFRIYRRKSLDEKPVAVFLTNGEAAWALPPGRIASRYGVRVYLPPDGWWTFWVWDFDWFLTQWVQENPPWGPYKQRRWA